MGLNRFCLKLMIRLHKELRFEGPVLCLGNQDIWARYDDLRSFFKEVDCPFREVESIKTTSANFSRMGPRYKNFVHARTFFAMMGIDDYWDVDKYDDDKPVLLHDLNSPLPPSLCNRFSLVVDGGTTEHIFDIRSALENVVRSLRVGGWVMHTTPSLSLSFFDHGFYGFSPCIFLDFYQANGFSDFRCYVVQNHSKLRAQYDNSFAEDAEGRCTYVEYPFVADAARLLDARKPIGLFFLARKCQNLDTIQIPTQGCYDPKRRHESVASSPSLFESWVPKPVQPMLRPLLPALDRFGVRHIVLRVRARNMKKVL